MSYGSGSFNDAKDYYNQAVTYLNNGDNDSARSKLEQAKQIFQQCLGTNAEAQHWIDKTNKKLSQI